MEKKQRNLFETSIKRIGQASIVTDHEVAEDYLQEIDDILFEQEHPWLYEEKQKDGCFPIAIGIIGITATTSLPIMHKVMELMS